MYDRFWLTRARHNLVAAFPPRRDDHPTFLFMTLSAVGFVVLYVALDKLSYLNPIGNLNITPWNPPPALSIAMVLNVGWPAIPLTILAPWVSDIVVRGYGYSEPLSVCTATVIGLGYSMAGMVIRRQGLARDPRQLSSLAAIILISSAFSLLVGTIYSSVMVAGAALRPDEFLLATATQWIGDTNGIVVALPLLLLARTAGGIRWPAGIRELAILLGQYLLLGLTLWLVFSPLATDDFQYFFLLFLPAIWIPLRWGVDMTAVSMALLELVLIVIMVSTPYPHEYFLEFQMRMVVLTVTSLLLAAVVSERIRSARAVREKDEKLAGVAQILAIGEMSSAIAHEINNPLAALRNYLRSARLMTDAPAIDHAALTTTLDKAVAEAERTSDVVRRLRAFYTAGVVERQGIDPHRVASECLELLSGKLNRLGIRTVVSAAPGLPPVWADPLQISIVLQNLVNNAADALAAEGSPSKEISVVLENAGATVEFRVGDNAGGIALNLVNHLFEPFKTTKAGGMGLGLAICRSLVEANGGRIWLARSGPEGACVAFSVPTGNAVVIEAPHE